MNRKYIKSHILKLALLVLLISNHGYKLYGSTNATKKGISPSKSTQRIEKYIYKQTPQGELAMYVHFPEDWTTNDKRPAIVFFFGGGWVGGNIEELVPHAEYLAKRGMVTARADYRIKSRHGTMPDKCVEDGKSALRWLRVNATRLGIDPNRITASGVSAGGHVAASTCTTKGLEAQGEETSISSKPNLLVLFEPVLQCAGLVREVGSKEMAVRISPHDNLTKDITPLVVLCGMEDWLIVEAVEFVEKCKKLGIIAELYTAEGQEHGALLKSPWLERAIYLMDKFLAMYGYTQGEPTIKLTEGKVEMKKILPTNLNVKDTWAYTPLHRAARNGQKELVKHLISNGADVNAKDNWFTPLFYTFRCGDKELVEFLIDHGADVNAKGRWGRTPLYYAAGRGDKELIELFIAKGADVNVKDPTSDATLHNAVKSRSAGKDIIELLITKGADVNAKNVDGQTALHIAIQRNRREIVKLLIENEADVNTKNKEGQTPLDIATIRNRRDIVELLIAKGADVSLHSAARQGLLEKIRELIGKGSDINSTDFSGQTALHYAARRGHKEIVELLLANGANVNTKDNQGLTPTEMAMSRQRTHIAKLLVDSNADISSIHLAAFAGNLAKVKTFLQMGININAQDSNGRTPLHYAATAAVAEFLIANGATIHTEDKNGETPLHTAAAAGFKDVGELLIKNGANVNANKSGNTSLSWAIWRNHKDVIRSLVINGADVNFKAKNDWPFLHYVVWNNDKDLVELFVTHGADVNFTPKDDYPPLHYALWKENVESVKLLVNRGARFNVKDQDGWTTFRYVVSGGNHELIEFFIAQGAKTSDFHMAAWLGDLKQVERFVEQGTGVNTKDNHLQWTPLHWAAFTGSLDVAEFLLAKGASINVKDEFNSIPLHYATINGHKEFVELLLANGSKFNIKDNFGNMPLHYAVGQGHLEIVKLLIAKGADINAETDKGKNTISLAKDKGHTEIVELLKKHGARE